MRLEFKLPDVGEGIAEAEIVEYLVKPGDRVKADQNVVRIETDKAMVELPAPESGVIISIPHKPGDKLLVGETILVIETDLPAAMTEKPAPAPNAAPVAKATFEAAGAPAPALHAPVTMGSRVLATPHTRKLARELGVEIESLRGSGPHGRISDDDIRAAAARPVPAVVSSPSVVRPLTSDLGPIASAGTRVPLKGIRKRTAEAMARSWSMIPHVTHADEADVTILFEFIARSRDGAGAEGVRLTALPFVMKAVAAALRKFPSFNASLDDAKGELCLHDRYHLGFAADTPAGLMVPVVKDAARKSVREIAVEVAALSAKARDRTIAVDELRDGTFTISNLGGIGGVHATPIILHPQVAILALLKARKMPVVREDAVVIRTIMPLALSFDHRVIDGAEAARFTNHLVGLLEDPLKLLIES